MNAIEKRARELLGKAVGKLEVGGLVSASGQLFIPENSALHAIIDALMQPEGYVLVPVALVKAVQDLSLIYEAGGDIDSKLSEVEAILAALPEVKP